MKARDIVTTTTEGPEARTLHVTDLSAVLRGHLPTVVTVCGEVAVWRMDMIESLHGLSTGEYRLCPACAETAETESLTR